VGLMGQALGAGRMAVVAVAVLTSVVGAFYYLRVLSVMFMAEGQQQAPVVRSPWSLWALWLSVGLTLILGVLPNLFTGYAQSVLAGFVG
jgi:NADH-quinone oxidoreductase subunit N